MTKPDPQAIDKILKNPHFKAIIKQMQDDYTALVMAPGTSDEDALEFRKENAALCRMIEKLIRTAKE